MAFSVCMVSPNFRRRSHVFDLDFVRVEVLVVLVPDVAASIYPPDSASRNSSMRVPDSCFSRSTNTAP